MSLKRGVVGTRGVGKPFAMATCLTEPNQSSHVISRASRPSTTIADDPIIHSMSIETTLLSDWSGGLNEVSKAIDLAPNETSDTLNTEIRGKGTGVAPRGGLSKAALSGTAFPDVQSEDGLTHMFYWVQDDVVAGSITGTLICSIDGDIWAVSNTGVRSQLFDGTAAVPANTWDFQTAKSSSGANRLWAVNGVDNNKKITTALVVSDWTINNGSDKKPKCICYWKGRMVAAGGTIENSRLIFSVIGDPDNWNANDFLDLRDVNDVADPILDMVVLGEDLIVFRRNSIWRVYDSVNFTNQKIHDVGIARLGQVDEFEGALYFPSRSGFYSTNGVNLTKLSNKLNLSKLSSDNSSVAISREGILYWVVYNSGDHWVYTLDLSMETLPWMKHRLGKDNHLFRATAVVTRWVASNLAERIHIGGWYTSSPSSKWMVATAFAGSGDWDFNNDVAVDMEAYYETPAIRAEDDDSYDLKRVVRANVVAREWRTDTGVVSPQKVTLTVENENGDSEVKSVANPTLKPIANLKAKFALRVREFSVKLSWVSRSVAGTEEVSEVNQLEVKYRR